MAADRTPAVASKGVARLALRRHRRFDVLLGEGRTRHHAVSSELLRVVERDVGVADQCGLVGRELVL